MNWEKQLDKTLQEIIDGANRGLTLGERAEFLVLLAQKMDVEPDKLIYPSLNWRPILSDWGIFQSSTQTAKKEDEP